MDQKTLRHAADDTKMENAAMPKFLVETRNREDSWQRAITGGHYRYCALMLWELLTFYSEETSATVPFFTDIPLKSIPQTTRLYDIQHQRQELPLSRISSRTKHFPTVSRQHSSDRCNEPSSIYLRKLRTPLSVSPQVQFMRLATATSPSLAI